MKHDGRVTPRLKLAGKVPEGHVILCGRSGDEHTFLIRSLGISVECPRCGAVRAGVDLAVEAYPDTAVA